MLDIVHILPPGDRKQFSLVSRQFHEVSQEYKRHALNKSEAEEAQRAVQQASDVFDELNNEYNKALQDLTDGQKAISTKNPVASQSSDESELTKLSKLRQNMRSAQEALANQERQRSVAQNNLERWTDELERAKTGYAECLKKYTLFSSAFAHQIKRLEKKFRPFSQAWLLNVAPPLKNPSAFSKLNPFCTDGQEADQHDKDIMDTKPG
ncbi:hypothetical protein IWQ60_006537 [Tieghemiomyces parasiticus]|uniref:Uncharacterized protein n=1 Tax=Tieghemiomyces parasiticus TaxID=78921 RepID=A0A9W8ACV2_9FUNG|nr:hypothetical protein IWQ60_006537 [Tieghemiomyces parasiticus]